MLTFGTAVSDPLTRGGLHPAPMVAALSRVRIVDRFPSGGPSFALLGRYATVVG